MARTRPNRPRARRRSSSPTSRALTLVLASKSPQRRAILSQLGIAFDVVPSAVDEATEGEPSEVVLLNARAKAQAVWREGLTVLGCDTEVFLDGRIFGKAATAGEARAMLVALDGRTHEVVGGLCLLAADGEQREAVATTRVTFRAVDDALLDWYLDTEEWRERAGAYAIQGRGAAFIERIDGDYLNVVGLPVAALLDLAPELLNAGAG